MRRVLLCLAAAVMVSVVNPAAAHAIAIRPVTKVAARSNAAMRKAPAKPKPASQSQVHRGGLDGAIPVVSIIDIRREGAAARRSSVSSRAGLKPADVECDQARARANAATLVRAAASLPSHWCSTHLVI